MSCLISKKPSALEELAELALAAASAQAWQSRAALHLLDWLGCAARGAHSAQGEIFARWLGLQAGGVRPTLAGRLSDAAAAAAYHGALGSVLEMDDIHRSSILHPGPVVIPAVLAAAHSGTSGAQLLAAMLAGYEVMIRVGRALGPSHYRYWHSTATAGSFGAAAGAALVLGLGAPRVAQALALAGTRAGGLWQLRHESSLAKSWHMAGAARDGLAAAQLAAAGLTGPLGVLDGESGWFAATAAQADVGLLTQPRTHPWLEDVSFKPWPACRHAHPAMDALREALGDVQLAPGRISSVRVHTYADALRFCDRPTPVDEAQARFSIQHALAAQLLWGEPRFEHYIGAALQDPALLAIRATVSVQLGEAQQSSYPEHYGAAVSVSCVDGQVYAAQLQDCRGDPARPMSEPAVHAKAGSLMAAAGWPAPRVAAALAACQDLPQASDLAALERVMLEHS